MYFQIQDTKYSVWILVDYFTSVAVTVYDTGRHREIQIVYNTGRHHAAACFSQHTRFATVVQVSRTGVTTVERVIDFSIFDIGGLLLGQRSPKGKMTYYPPRSTILQNFSPIAQTKYGLLEFFTLWR